jgi:hypothetical protein
MNFFDSFFDLSTPIVPNLSSCSAFNLDYAQSNFVCSVKEGSSINVQKLHLIPHGHCTHTESIAHISKSSFKYRLGQGYCDFNNEVRLIFV